MHEDDCSGWEIGSEPDRYWEAGEYYFNLWRDNNMENTTNIRKAVYIILKTDEQGFTHVIFASLDKARATDLFVEHVKEQMASEIGIDIPSDWHFTAIYYTYLESSRDYPSPLYYEFIEQELL
jgi:hypothetical protein